MSWSQLCFSLCNSLLLRVSVRLFFLSFWQKTLSLLSPHGQKKKKSYYFEVAVSSFCIFSLAHCECFYVNTFFFFLIMCCLNKTIWKITVVYISHDKSKQKKLSPLPPFFPTIVRTPIHMLMLVILLHNCERYIANYRKNLTTVRELRVWCVWTFSWFWRRSPIAASEQKRPSYKLQQTYISYRKKPHHRTWAKGLVLFVVVFWCFVLSLLSGVGFRRVWEVTLVWCCVYV